MLGKRDVEHRLTGAIRHGCDQVRERRAEPAGRCEDLLALVDRPVVAQQQGRHRHALRRRQQGRVGLRLVGQRGAEIPVEAQHRGRLIQRVEHHAAQNLADRVELILEGRHDAEIAAAAAQRPEQVGILLGACLPQLAIGRDHLGRYQVVDRQAMLSPSQPRPPPSVSPPMPVFDTVPPVVARPCACVAAVEIAPLDAALGTRCPLGGIDADRLHRRQVDNQASIIGAIAGGAVAAASNRHQQAPRSRKIHSLLHVGSIHALHDHRRAAIDIAVPDPAGRLVALVTGQEHWPSKAGPQRRNLRRRQCRTIPVQRHDVDHDRPPLVGCDDK